MSPTLRITCVPRRDIHPTFFTVYSYTAQRPAEQRTTQESLCEYIEVFLKNCLEKRVIKTVRKNENEDID